MLDIDAFKRIVETVAFHQLVGITLEKANVSTGIAVLRLPYNPKLSLFPEIGAYHGGAIASLIDTAGSVICGLQAGRPAPTINFRVDFLKSPVKIDLLATGRLIRAGKSVSVADAEISDDHGAIYAIGRGTFSTAASVRAIQTAAEAAKQG